MSAVRLSDLLRRDVQADPEITGITADSRKVASGHLFVALPGTAADGTPLVCVNMGASGFSWVSGPSPQGVGTASDGGSCVDGDVGGQDEQGRMMMCVNGEWVYGP